jgi:RNA polymerase sigma-70 factor (ECF subfamily)
MEKSDVEKMFFELYENEADAIFRFVFFKVNDREIALDITQESFVRTWEYLSKGKMIANKRAFLYRVAGNRVIDHYRKHKGLSLDALKESGFDVPDEQQAEEDLKLDAKKSD